MYVLVKIIDRYDELECLHFNMKTHILNDTRCDWKEYYFNSLKCKIIAHPDFFFVYWADAA